MDASEATPLVGETRTKTLPWMMAALCFVDLFGVFPVIALPRPIIDCGWIGIPLALFVISLQIYTAKLLGKCWLIAEVVDPSITLKTRYPYAALAELCFGGKIRRFVSILLDVTLFSGGIPNLLVASQMLQLVGLKETNYGVNISFCYWLLILGILLCPMMWFGSPKDMKCVAISSCCTVLTVASLTWTCMILDDTEFRYPTEPVAVNWESVAIAYGILAFQFDIHPMVLTVQVDMENKNKLGNAIIAGFSVSSCLLFVTTALAMGKYGSAVKHNLLQGLPGSGLLYVTIMLVTLQICLSMVVGGSPLFQDIEDKLNIPREFNYKRCILRSSLVLSSVLLAEMVPRFDLIMGLMGGALTSPLMFIFPTLFYLKLKSLQAARERDLQSKLANYEKPPPYNPYIRDPETFNRYFSNPEYSHLQNKSHNNVNKNRIYDDIDGSDNELNFEPVLPTEVDVNMSYYGEEFMTPARGFESPKLVDVRSGINIYEKLMCVMIIILGILATVAATYFSLRDTLKYSKLTPPCFP